MKSVACVAISATSKLNVQVKIYTEIMSIFRQPRLLKQSAAFVRLYSDAKAWSQDEIQKAISKEKIVVFMKGVPEEPRCGFSNAVVQILRMHGVKYDAYNVLENEKLRQAIKDFSQWPTIPQVYVDGNFIGGCDILLQMHHSGDLIEELGRAGIKSALLSSSKKENN